MNATSNNRGNDARGCSRVLPCSQGYVVTSVVDEGEHDCRLLGRVLGVDGGEYCLPMDRGRVQAAFSVEDSM